MFINRLLFLSVLSLSCTFFMLEFFIENTQAADCNHLNTQAYQAYKTKDSAKLLVFLKQSKSICANTNYIQNLTARVLYDQTQNLPLNEQLKKLQFIMSIAPLNTKTAWLSQEKYGDILHQQSFYEPAFRAYEKALNIIGMPTNLNTHAVPQVHLVEAPKPERILSIHRKAQRERLLTDSIILSSRGKKTGVELLGFKGSCVTQVAYPITFDTGVARANKRGMVYANQLKKMLDAYNQPVITIVGHTDERNQKHQNQQLSEDRANFVKHYLESQGYRSRINSIGMSSKQHFDDPEYEYYPDEKRWKLDRRVEVEISKSICEKNSYEKK